jgi:hypothetical protein
MLLLLPEGEIGLEGVFDVFEGGGDVIRPIEFGKAKI